MPPHFASNDRLLLLPDVGIGKRAPLLVFPKKECCWSPRGADPGRGEKVFITAAIMSSYKWNEGKWGTCATIWTSYYNYTARYNSFPCISPRVCAKATELILEVVVTALYAGAKHVEIISEKGKVGGMGVCRSDGIPKKKLFLGFLRLVYPNKALSRIRPWASYIYQGIYLQKQRVRFFVSYAHSYWRIPFFVR